MQADRTPINEATSEEVAMSGIQPPTNIDDMTITTPVSSRFPGILRISRFACIKD